MEGRRIDRRGGPAGRVRVLRFGFGSAAEFFDGFGMALFVPLEHFNVTLQFQSVDGNGRKIRISEDIVGLHGSRRVDEFVVIGDINGIGSNFDALAGSFLQGAIAFDRSAFIPEKQHDRDSDKDDPDEDPF